MSDDEKVPPPPPELLEALRQVEESLEVPPDIRAEVGLLRLTLGGETPPSYRELATAVHFTGSGTLTVSDTVAVSDTATVELQPASGSGHGNVDWRGEGSGYAPPLGDEDLQAVEEKAGPRSRAWLDQVQRWGPLAGNVALSITRILGFVP